MVRRRRKTKTMMSHKNQRSRSSRDFSLRLRRKPSKSPSRKLKKPPTSRMRVPLLPLTLQRTKMAMSDQLKRRQILLQLRLLTTSISMTSESL